MSDREIWKLAGHDVPEDDGAAPNGTGTSDAYAEELTRNVVAFLKRAARVGERLETLMDSDELFDLRGTLDKYAARKSSPASDTDTIDIPACAVCYIPWGEKPWQGCTVKACPRLVAGKEST